jgi:hypothetical protein
MKMGQISVPETLVIHQKLTPGYNPKTFKQHYDHGGSLQPQTVKLFNKGPELVRKVAIGIQFLKTDGYIKPTRLHFQMNNIKHCRDVKDSRSANFTTHIAAVSNFTMRREQIESNSPIRRAMLVCYSTNKSSVMSDLLSPCKCDTNQPQYPATHLHHPHNTTLKVVPTFISFNLFQ